jgi:hypothetical protein
MGNQFNGGSVQEDTPIRKGMRTEVKDASQRIGRNKLLLTPGLPVIFGAATPYIK